MKKLYLLPLATLLTLSVASCKDDSDQLPTLTDKSYEGLTELNLIYNGSPMVGKTATLSGNILTFDSKVDFGSISESLKDLPPIPGAGVLPGSPVLPLQLTFAPNKDKYSVAGSGETPYVTYSYLGSLTDTKVDFNFYNVKLKDSRLAGKVFKPVKADSKTGASPFHIVWETSQPGLLEYFDGSVQDALRLLVNLPVFPAYNGTAYMSATQIIESGVTALSFNSYGNFVITYLQKANGAAQFAQAPLCMLQYLPVGDNTLKMFVNPTDLVSLIIMNNTNKPYIPEHPFGKSVGRADAGTSSLLSLLTPEEQQLLMTTLSPMFSEGFPMRFTMAPDDMELYIPTEVMVPLVKNIIAPLLAKPEVQQMILERVEGIASLQPYLPMVKGLMLALPLILETTTKAEIGLSLQAR